MARRPAVRRLSKPDGRTSSVAHNGVTILTPATIRSMAQHFGPCRNTRRTPIPLVPPAGALGSRKLNINTDYENDISVRGGGRSDRLRWSFTRIRQLLYPWGICSNTPRLD